MALPYVLPWDAFHFGHDLGWIFFETIRKLFRFLTFFEDVTAGSFRAQALEFLF